VSAGEVLNGLRLRLLALSEEEGEGKEGCKARSSGLD